MNCLLNQMAKSRFFVEIVISRESLTDLHDVTRLALKRPFLSKGSFLLTEAVRRLE